MARTKQTAKRSKPTTKLNHVMNNRNKEEKWIKPSLKSNKDEKSMKQESPEEQIVNK